MKKLLILVILFHISSCNIGMKQIQKYSDQLPSEYKKLEIGGHYDTTYKNINREYGFIQSLALKSSDGVLIAEDWEYYNRGFMKKKKTFEYKGKKYMEYWYFTDNKLTGILYKILVYDDESNPVGYVSYESVDFD